MKHKKLILRRAAVIAGAVAAVGLIAALIAKRIHDGRQQRQRQAALEHREQRIDEARQLLFQMAERMRSLPVDPAALAEIEPKHFEANKAGRMLIWAMDAKGEFLFGLPSEPFARLNAAYDRCSDVIREDGHFADRQEFLRELILSQRDFDFSCQKARGRRGDDWRFYRDWDSDHPVVSVPLRDDNSLPLGTAYAKLDIRYEDSGRGSDAVLRFAVVTFTIALLFLWLLLPSWVYLDARERGVRRALLWSFLTLISAFVGLFIYLVARPEQPRQLSCPACGHEVNGAAYCPYCGASLAGAFCSACRYPLQSDWTYCPACRTEIRRPAPATQGAASQTPDTSA